jgi:hypothetical protein
MTRIEKEILSEAIGCQNDEVLVGYGFKRQDINHKFSSLYGCFYNYILYYNGEISYIGYTKSLYERLTKHKSARDFDEIIIIQYPNEKLARHYERQLIKEYKPIENIQYLRTNT